MLRHERSSHRFQGRADPIRMQHREEPPLRAPLDRRGPGVGACCGLRPGEIEDMHHAFLYELAFEDLTDGNGLGEGSNAAMHPLHCLPELGDVVCH